MIINAPAKINLTLEVLGKRADGYHDIRSVIQTISLGDELSFELSKQTEYKSDLPGWAGEKSLAAKTVELLRQTTGTKKDVSIFVKKRIPLVAGLGGDSSNAAAILKGLNELWELGLSTPKLLELAAQLGSDVPFFIYGGTVLMEGRGEVLTPLPAVKPLWLVLMMPDVPTPRNKTATMYGSLRAGNHFTDGKITQDMVKTIKDGKPIKPEQVFNTFENVVFDNVTSTGSATGKAGNKSMYPELKVYRDHILKIGATNLHLAGSGPSLFSIVKGREEGEELAARLQNQGMQIELVETIN